MRIVSTFSLFVAGLLLAGAVLVGCTSESGVESEPTATSSETESAIPEEIGGIAELPEADQKAALEQEVCPVSGKPLGSMGAPIKVSVEGQDVFVCCDGCVDTVKENPDEYLAKLKKE